MNLTAIASFIASILISLSPAEEISVSRVSRVSWEENTEKQEPEEVKQVLGVKKVGEAEIIGEKYIPSPSPEVHRNPGVSVKQEPQGELFEKYGGEYGVEPNLLKKICQCESHCNPNAVNGYYGGMYQYTPGSWKSTRRAMGLDPNPDLRFNAEESIRTTAFKIANGGIGAWPNCR